MIQINIWAFPLCCIAIIYTVIFLLVTGASIFRMIAGEPDPDDKWLLGILALMMWINAALFTKVITINLIQ